MQDQIRNFIERCGGHASSMAIASHVLRMRNTTPASAERVLEGLLKTDKRFASDGVGNWHLTQIEGARVENTLEPPCLVFTPMRAGAIANANRLVLGWMQPPRTAHAFVEVVLQNGEHVREESRGMVAQSRSEFLQRDFPKIQASVLLAWNLSAVLAVLRKVVGNTPAAWLPPTTVSLQNLARNLLRLPRKPKLEAIYRELFQQPLRSESWEDQLHAHAEIWEALRPRCLEHGLQHWQQIAHYARRAQRPDFSQYEFDEKYIANLPEAPGVYVMRDREQRVIYVGKAANLRERVGSYFANDVVNETKLQQIRARVARLHYEVHDTELEALLREQALIKRLRPSINRQHNVYLQAATHPEKLRGIFLVPMRPQAPHATKGRVMIYFLSAKSLNRLPVNLARIPKQRLRKAIAKYLQQCAQNSPTKSMSQDHMEIAARWFQHNRAWISSLTVAEGEPAGEIENRVLRLLHTPEIFHERVQLVSHV